MSPFRIWPSQTFCFDKNVRTSNLIPLKFVSTGLINNIPALVQIMKKIWHTFNFTLGTYLRLISKKILNIYDTKIHFKLSAANGCTFFMSPWMYAGRASTKTTNHPLKGLPHEKKKTGQLEHCHPYGLWIGIPCLHVPSLMATSISAGTSPKPWNDTINYPWWLEYIVRYTGLQWHAFVQNPSYDNTKHQQNLHLDFGIPSLHDPISNHVGIPGLSTATKCPVYWQRVP